MSALMALLEKLFSFLIRRSEVQDVLPTEEEKREQDEEHEQALKDKFK